MRTCNKCKEEKSLDEYHNVKSFPLGKAYTCKLCAKARSRKWNRQNKERKKEQGRKHYEENKDQYLERSKNSTWAKDNPERTRELGRIRYRRDNGAEKVAFYRHKRRRATPEWLTEKQKEAIASLYWLCRDLECVSGQKYHVDHIVPINGENVCGLHVPWNLQVLPADLNIQKSNGY